MYEFESWLLEASPNFSNFPIVKLKYAVIMYYLLQEENTSIVLIYSTLCSL